MSLTMTVCKLYVLNCNEASVNCICVWLLKKDLSSPAHMLIVLFCDSNCRPSINFATADCCMECTRVVLHFVLDVIGSETGCHYRNGDWMYGTEVYNGDQDYPTDTEITLDFKFEQSSIKVISGISACHCNAWRR